MADQVFAVISGFYDAINEDRTYTADQMNRPYRRLVSNGVFATPAGTPSTDLQVNASNGMVVTVKPGDGIFGNKWFENPAVISITVPSNVGVAPRIDSVIAQIDKRVSGRVGNIVYRTGAPSSNPVPPNINTQENVIEYRLANIRVVAGAVAISQANITDTRGSSECPWVTSLIYQVDTSTLWQQYRDAYQEYFDEATADFEQYTEEQRAAFEQFLQSLTEELTVSTEVIKLTSSYVTSSEVLTVPIGIESYERDTDVLEVYINGLHVAEGVKYEVSQDGASIVLKGPLLAGQLVNFVVYKSVISADLGTTVTMIQRLDNKLSSFMADSGWIPMQSQNGASAYNTNLQPAVRAVGNRVYIRGALKGATAAGTVLCTLPLSCRPAIDHFYIVPAESGLTMQGVVAITVSAATGSVVLSAVYGSITSTSMIPIATTFLAAEGYTTALVFNFMGTVEEYDDLPENPQGGDVYEILTADSEHGIAAGDTVFWNGMEWEKLESSITSADIDEIIGNVDAIVAIPITNAQIDEIVNS